MSGRKQSQVFGNLRCCSGAILIVIVPLHWLPDTGATGNVVSTIQAFVAVVAIVLGAIFAYDRFQVFRTFYPHLTIEHTITHRRISDNYMHIAVTAILHNRSRVHTEVREGFASLQVVAPLSDADAAQRYNEVFVGRQHVNIQWETLDEYIRAWEESELVVEPDESHPETFEFLLRESSYNSVLIYTYFYNERHDEDRGSAEGWAATTVYNIVDADERK